MEACEPIWDVEKARREQRPVGRFCRLAILFPFVRRMHGFEKINPAQRYLFVCNHISLLDALVIGGHMIRHQNSPTLILADKKTWDESWGRRAISRPVGFLLERGKTSISLIKELQAFGRAGENYNLIVFPEGTRGNGVDVAECQPGIHYIAQAARLPMVPVFIKNMQLVSTKSGPFRWFSGLNKVEVFFGDAIAPEDYLSLPREEFPKFVREKIHATRG
jgi:1-acyl-sn-glycerol-3-phosphate acyltransferase